MPFWSFCHLEQLFLKFSHFVAWRDRFEQVFAKLEPFWPNYTVLSSVSQIQAILGKITVLKSFCQKRPFRQNHCLWASFAKIEPFWPKPLFLEYFAKIKPFWPKHTVLSRFCQNNAILAILPFWAALSEIQPFLPEETVLSRFSPN